jgi:hypothetical protein
MKRLILACALIPAFAVAQEQPAAPVISGCATLSWSFPAEREAEVKNFVVKNGYFTRGTIPANQRSIQCSSLVLAAGVNPITIQAIGVVSGNNSEILAAPVEYVPPPLPAPTNPVYE